MSLDAIKRRVQAASKSNKSEGFMDSKSPALIKVTVWLVFLLLSVCLSGWLAGWLAIWLCVVCLFVCLFV